MRKTLLLMALAFGTTGAFAQDGMTSKKGEPILPETDDWALMIDAAPVMDYLGNMLNGTNSSPSWGYPGTPLAITGKMFKDEKTAYRGMVRLGFGSSKWSNYVQDDVAVAADPLSTNKVSDELKSAYNQIVLGGGLEMRRGKTRLQGFYGGMLMIGLGGSKDTYTYGNAYTQTNTSPTSTTAWTPISSGPAASRTLTDKNGSTFMLGIRGFIGAEYFIFPKMAVGAEFGWGVGMSSTGEGEKTTEAWDGVGNVVKTTTTKTGKSSTFGFDTDVNGSQMMPAGALTLTLHF